MQWCRPTTRALPATRVFRTHIAPGSRTTGMPRPRPFALTPAVSLTVLGLGTRAALADYEAPNPAYAPPTNYYYTATGTGIDLRTNLHTIITAGFVGRSYGDSRYSMATKN